MINQSDESVSNQVIKLNNILAKFKILPENCFFITPTYEMQVKSNRNIPHRNLKNVLHLTSIIKNALGLSCTHISGVDLMKNSPYFDGVELLIRDIIPTDLGCGGAAENDNVHICGKAAKDFAQRLCSIIN